VQFRNEECPLNWDDSYSLRNNQPRSERALPVKVSRRFGPESAVFDDGNLVSSAGLVPRISETDHLDPQRHSHRNRFAHHLPRQRTPAPRHTPDRHHAHRHGALPDRTGHPPRRRTILSPRRSSPLPRRPRTPPRQTRQHRAATYPSLRGKHVTMHTLRHTAAMRLLQAGVDVSVIAHWLGHQHTSSTDVSSTPLSPET
jgi:hypothetical protein